MRVVANLNGRNSAAVIAWLAEQDPEWKKRITHVSMDTSATYARAARLALPDAVIVVDRFHLAALANWGGHRVPAGAGQVSAWSAGPEGPEWAQRNRLLRAGEALTEDEAGKMHDATRVADASGGLEKCVWQGTEMLRALLALAGTDPDRNLIWNQLTDLYINCAESEVHQLRRLAWTVYAWQPSIIEGLTTGDQKRPHRGLQPDRQARRKDRLRLPEHRASQAPDRFACTRSSRRAPTRTLKPC